MTDDFAVSSLREKRIAMVDIVSPSSSLDKFPRIEPKNKDEIEESAKKMFESLKQQFSPLGKLENISEDEGPEDLDLRFSPIPNGTAESTARMVPEEFQANSRPDTRVGHSNSTSRPAPSQTKTVVLGPGPTISGTMPLKWNYVSQTAEIVPRHEYVDRVHHRRSKTLVPDRHASNRSDNYTRFGQSNSFTRPAPPQTEAVVLGPGPSSSGTMPPKYNYAAHTAESVPRHKPNEYLDRARHRRSKTLVPDRQANNRPDTSFAQSNSVSKPASSQTKDIFMGPGPSSSGTMPPKYNYAAHTAESIPSHKPNEFVDRARSRRSKTLVPDYPYNGHWSYNGHKSGTRAPLLSKPMRSLETIPEFDLIARAELEKLDVQAKPAITKTTHHEAHSSTQDKAQPLRSPPFKPAPLAVQEVPTKESPLPAPAPRAVPPPRQKSNGDEEGEAPLGADGNGHPLPPCEEIPNCSNAQCVVWKHDAQMKIREIEQKREETKRTLDEMFHAKEAYKKKYNDAEARRLSLEDTSNTLQSTLGLGDREVKNKDLEIDQLKSNVADAKKQIEDLTKNYKKIWNENTKLRKEANENRAKPSNPESIAETIRNGGNVPETSDETLSKTHAPLLALNQELRTKLTELETTIKKRDKRIDELQRSLTISKRATSDAVEKAQAAEENLATNRRFFENEKKELLKEVESLTQRMKCLKPVSIKQENEDFTELQIHIEAARQKKLELDAALDKFKNKRCENCEALNAKYQLMEVKCSRMEAEIKSKVESAQENAVIRTKLETKLDEIHARQKSSISVAVQSDRPTMTQSSTQCEAPTTVNRRIQCSPMTIEQCTQIRDDLIPMASSSTQWVDPDPKVLVESETQSEPPAAKFAIATQSDPTAKVTSSTQSDAPNPKMSVETQSDPPVLVPTTSAQVQTDNLVEDEPVTTAAPENTSPPNDNILNTPQMPVFKRMMKRKNTGERNYISRRKRARKQAPRQSNSAEPKSRTMKTDSGFSSVSESLPSITPDTPRPNAEEIKGFFDIFEMSVHNSMPITATTTLPDSDHNIAEQEDGMTCARVNTPYDHRKTATKRKTVKSVPEILEAAFKKRNKKLSMKTGLDIAQVTQWLEMRQRSGHVLTAEQTQAIFEPVRGSEAQDSMEVGPEAQVAQNVSGSLNVAAEQPLSSRISQTEPHREGQRRLVSIKAEVAPETEVIAQEPTPPQTSEPPAAATTAAYTMSDVQVIQNVAQFLASQYSIDKNPGEQKLLELSNQTGLSLENVKQFFAKYELQISSGQPANAVEPPSVQNSMPQTQNAHVTAQQPLNVQQPMPQAIHSDFNNAGHGPYGATAHVTTTGPIPTISGNFQEDPINWLITYVESQFKSVVRLSGALIKQLSQETNLDESMQNAVETPQFMPLSPNSFADLCAGVGTSDQHLQNSNIQNQNLLMNLGQQQPQIQPMAFPAQSSSSHVIQFSAPQFASGNQPQQYPAQNRQNPGFSGQIPIQNLSQAQSRQYPNMNYQMGQFPLLSQALLNPSIQPQNVANFGQMPQARQMPLLPSTLTQQFNLPQQNLQQNAQQPSQMVQNKQHPQWRIDHQAAANMQNILGLMNCVNNIGQPQQPNFSGAPQQHPQHILQNQQPGYQFPGNNQACASNMPPQNVYLGGQPMRKPAILRQKPF
ncbi:hypothetical protein Ddc_16032 [Ditylenchus destructor]|nr:hypothetical protein Ddc_16032 [Ditylenchus destructor]